MIDFELRRVSGKVVRALRFAATVAAVGACGGCVASEQEDVDEDTVQPETTSDALLPTSIGNAHCSVTARAPYRTTGAIAAHATAECDPGYSGYTIRLSLQMKRYYRTDEGVLLSYWATLTTTYFKQARGVSGLTTPYVSADNGCFRTLVGAYGKTAAGPTRCL